jgi:hypothetical protein
MTATAKAASSFISDVTVGGINGAVHEGRTWTAWIARGIAGLRALAPYAAVELLLPGGSLLALMLWLYRRHRAHRHARVDAT